MDRLKETSKKLWAWIETRVGVLRKRFPPDFISNPSTKWIAGSIALLWFVVWGLNFLRGDSSITRLEFFQAMIASLGLMGLAANAVYTLKRANAIEEQVKVSEKQLKTADDAQITERFSRAIEHLGSGSPQIMIGGIYALERIAKDYQKNYHQTVMEVLTAFIRGFEREEPIEKVPPELQAAVTVVCRRDIEWEKASLPNFVLDLSKADLRSVQMWDAELAGANLMDANLTQVNLFNADLTETVFRGANLSYAYILEATMFETSFGNADLQGVDFSGLVLNANLQGADNLTLQQVLKAKSYKDAILFGEIETELKTYLEEKQAAANQTATEPIDPKDSAANKLPDADVSGAGESQD